MPKINLLTFLDPLIPLPFLPIIFVPMRAVIFKRPLAVALFTLLLGELGFTHRLLPLRGGDALRKPLDILTGLLRLYHSLHCSRCFSRYCFA